MGNQLGGLGPTIIAVMWLQQIMAYAFVGLRLYCRTSLTSSTAKWGADDILMVIGVTLMTGYTCFCTVAATHGFGQRAALLTQDEFVTANKLEIIGQTFCILAIAITKAGVAAFQMRIYKKKWQIGVLIATVIAVAGICFFCALFDFVRCNPVAAVWNPFITDAVCFVSTQSFTFLSVSLSVICSAVDFIYAGLPWIALWNLQMPKSTKLVICGAMSLGVFAGACGIVRAVQLLGLNARSDYSYETVGLILWSQTELLVTIMTACIPTYRELWIRLFRGTRSSGYFNHSDDIAMSNKHSKGSTFGHSKQGIETQIYFNDSDDRSDRGILEEGTTPVTSHGGVKVTKDIMVNSEASR